MNITTWYSDHFESRLKGRYIHLGHLDSILDEYKDFLNISIIGKSERGLEIPQIKIGQGEKVIFGWSQMHGNESTTTKAIFDLLKFLSQKSFFANEIDHFLSEHTLVLIPILNVDGAKLFTRENFNGVDLNRDAQLLSQSESRALKRVFDRLKPSLCLNLHDQRSIYGLQNGLPATLSFLAPSANDKRNITPAREAAMLRIAQIYNGLKDVIPGGIGRYDDTFNENCVGDTFQKANSPTILFEAGHHKNDYNREISREYVFYAFLYLFNILPSSHKSFDKNDYLAILENKVNYKDVILRKVRINDTHTTVDIAIQYVEKLYKEKIEFIPTIDMIGDLSEYFAHNEISLNGQEVILDSNTQVQIGQEFLRIIDKNNESVEYFSKEF